MLKRLIRDLADRLDRLLLPLTSRSGLVASAHYLFLSRQFRREHRAVLAGRLAYERGLKVSLRSSPLLRRNVHRLEKGLVMQPRQAVFAEDYIEETVAGEVALCRQSLGLRSARHPRVAKYGVDLPGTARYGQPPPSEPLP